MYDADYLVGTLKKLYIIIMVVVCLPLGLFAQETKQTNKPVVRTQADLPRYTYNLPTETVSALLTESSFSDFAAEVGCDMDKLLRSYNIEDKTTLRDIYMTLENIALLSGDYNAALEFTSKVRELEDKPAERLISGLVVEAIVAAERSGAGEVERYAVFNDVYESAINKLPWDTVQNAIKDIKTATEWNSYGVIVGFVQSMYDPAASKSGMISDEVARDIIRCRKMLEVEFPYKDIQVQVLRTYIQKNRVIMPSIWVERDIDLTDVKNLHPVVIGIWDTGVDTTVFRQQLIRNEAESINGRDDDGNGYVDDVNGIAYNKLGGEPTPELLFPLDEASRTILQEEHNLLKGYSDLQANVDSPEADELRHQLASMKPAEVQPFIEGLTRMFVYIHGTHVSGVAIAGNPASKIVVVRESFPYEMIPPPIHMKDAEKWAVNMQRTVDFLRERGTHVVNMSWGYTLKDLEEQYEINGIGNNSEERHRMAQETFDVLMTGMHKAISSAPGILFIVAAGNTDEDIDFVVDMPASIELPNVISVGAVDQAGQITSFTCTGRSIGVHANGFEVESYLPGGERLAFSGTSMAAPNVTNLAGKLVALDPSLTPESIIELIIKGADQTEDGRRVLINPKRSVEILKTRLQQN